MSSIAALDQSFEPSLVAPSRALVAPVGAPATVISLAGQLRVAAKQSAQVGLGGDFFEVFQHADGRVSIVVADVCGSGLAAAGLAAEIRPALHGALVRNESPSRVLAALNAGLLGVGGRDRFVTAVALRIDARLGTAELACAGHLGPFVRHGAGFAAPANDVSGVPLGLLSDETYGEATLELSPGDTLVLVTDGITDPLSSDADPLGAGELVRRLAIFGSARTGTAEDAASLCHALLDDRVPTRDDATVLVLQLPERDETAVA